MYNVKDITEINRDRLTTKHIGNYYLTGDRNHVSAYEIVSYENYAPKTVKFVGSVANHSLTWDQAYDLIVGKIEKPDFSKVLN